MKRYTEAELIDLENRNCYCGDGHQCHFCASFDLRKQRAAKQAAIQKAVAILEGSGDIPLAGYDRQIIETVTASLAAGAGAPS